MLVVLQDMPKERLEDNIAFCLEDNFAAEDFVSAASDLAYFAHAMKGETDVLDEGHLYISIGRLYAGVC